MSSSSIDYQSDIIYYNVSQVNNTDEYIPAEYSENRQTPILNVPQDYYMSVIRFDINAIDIPIFLWPNNSDGTPNNDYFYIGMSNGSFSSPKPVIFHNYSFFDRLNYHPVYSYQSFCDMINSTFNVLWVAAGKPYASQPFMTLDYTTGQYSFICSKEYLDGGWTFYFNSNLYFKFVNLQALQTTPDNYQIIVANRTFNILTNIQDPNNVIIATAYQMKQEYQNLYNLSSLSKILITSTRIPANYEYVSTLTNTASNSNSMKIISDYVAPNDAFIGANRSIFTYIPTAEYRLIDLNSKNPLLSVDFKFYWEDEQNVLHKIFLPPSSSFTIKIMFRKKTLAYKIHKDIEDKSGNLKKIKY